MSVSDTTHSFFMHDHWSADIAAAHPARDAAKGKELTAFAEEEPSFWDFLDLLNPLQHIPLVNTLYRELSGDQIGVAARLAGGALFGGPIGLGAATANAMIEQQTGKDVGSHLLAAIRGEDEAPAEPTMLAQAPEPEAEAPAQAESQIQVHAPHPDALTAPEPGSVQAATAVMFTVDGPVIAAASPAPAAMPAPSGRPLPLAEAQPARFMPLPPRPTEAVMRPPPPVITVPVSNNGARSAVPPTGRNPMASAPNSAAVQRMLEAQGLSDAQHPLLPGGQGGDQAWFAASMNAGLTKYEQASRLTDSKAADVLVQ